MLRDAFIGHLPTHFNFHPLVKAFILSDMILWSAYNLFTPILAVFVVSNIDGGNIQLAAIGFSLYMITRVVIEILSGQFLLGKQDELKFKLIVAGLLVLSLSYSIFSLTSSILFFYLGYIIMGVGFGVASPARLSLFSIHLDKNKEAQEWSLHDATMLIGMALAGSLGGFIAQAHGFSLLFKIAAVTNLIAIVPYLEFLKKNPSATNSIRNSLGLRR